MSRINKPRHIKGHETCKCKCRLDANICNNNVGIMINTDMNAKNLLIMKDVIKDLFGILLTVNVTNYVMLESI